MIAYQELMEHVVREGNAVDKDEARRALEAVTGALARHTRPDTRKRLRADFPAALRDHVPAQPDAPEMETTGALSEEVAQEIGCPEEKGVRLVGAVLTGIRESEPGLAEDLASQLPGELAQWAHDPEGAHGRADTGESGSPSRLDRPTLERALERLPAWQGDTAGLTRDVELPTDRVTPLLNQAEKAARRLGHSFEHRTTDSGVTFTVRTESTGAVTTRDIEMAERIDAAVATIGSGG
ncbi:DUF2267 domain-containing protein [Nocardiopsis xinjiangensis]|uniref:DUF2267 domain-containing protein n=1 Tax=Nocardiopsis xinjiangensis TaxID=124285 RepID=UPI000348B5AA|nr:DUF2267 domain-containing protein [Nocardiopsis xinjiangensis]